MTGRRSDAPTRRSCSSWVAPRYWSDPFPVLPWKRCLSPPPGQRYALWISSFDSSDTESNTWLISARCLPGQTADDVHGHCGEEDGCQDMPKNPKTKQRIHPRLPRASTTSRFTRKATVPLFTRLRTCATTSGVNFADSHRFNLTHKHLDEPQTAQLDPKTKAECSSYLLMWCEATAAGDLLWCREPVTKNHQSAKTYKTSCSVPVKIKSAQAGRWAFFHVFPTWWHKATMVVLLKNKYI